MTDNRTPSEPQDQFDPEETFEPELQNTRSGLIGYFAHNPVAANLLMIFILIIGLITYFTMQRQMFPNFEINYINVQIVYPGASPQEIEEGVILKIEESIKDVTEVERMISRAFRNQGRVTLEIDPDENLAEVMDKIKLRVDGIATLPAGMEPLVVYQQEFQQQVVEMSLTSDELSMEQLKPVAQQIETELLQLKNVSLVNLYTPDDEIAVEVSPDVLREYGLTISDISAAINRWSTNASAGQLRTDTGLVSVRIENQYYDGDEFRQIPVKIGSDGARVLLGDIATIKDGFTEGENYFRFNGRNAIHLQVNATKEQNTVAVSDSVNQWMEQRNKTLPHGMELKPLVDMTYYLNARLDMMLKNMLFGGILVAIMLSIFLRFRLAMWVMVGLPVCFLGAIMTMPFMGVTINIVSLFAFIMVLGIVVDDAIVIGESVYTEIEKKGQGGVHNVVIGARRVATPATFGVLTTIAVFFPFTFSSGPDSSFFTGIALVTIACLFFSLIESKLILPAHLAHMHFSPEKKTGWRAGFNRGFQNFIQNKYRPFVVACTEWRWVTFAVFIGMLMLGVSLMTSNLVRFIPMPSVPEDYPSISLEMNASVSDQQTIDALQALEKMIIKVDDEIQQEFGKPLVRDVLAYNDGRTDGRVLVALVAEEDRPFSAFELSRRWRENLPVIPGVKSLIINDKVGEQGQGDGDFGYLLYGADLDSLNAAARDMIERLYTVNGLYNISSTLDPAGKEIQIQLKPVAYELGITLADVASQVGGSFYGGEAQRVIRNGEELKVMVRYPETERQNYSSLRYALIKTREGQDVMLGDIAELLEKPGISYIRRERGFRSVYVYGSIDDQLVEPSEVNSTISDTILPEVLKAFPGVKTELGGDIKEQQDQASEQQMFFWAGMLIVYILLAVPLKSYSQPLIVMSVIPFSLTGALFGHFLLDMNLSMMSTFGLIAAAGVVINDSLVMTDYVNQLRKQGVSVADSVIEAGCARVRAITLTSITTFAGVAPIMLETSLQARFVIPMAVSLGFAVLYATVITLILVPCLYLIGADIGRAFRFVFGGIWRWIKQLFVRGQQTGEVS